MDCDPGTPAARGAAPARRPVADRAGRAHHPAGQPDRPVRGLEHADQPARDGAVLDARHGHRRAGRGHERDPAADEPVAGAGPADDRHPSSASATSWAPPWTRPASSPASWRAGRRNSSALLRHGARVTTQTATHRAALAEGTRRLPGLLRQSTPALQKLDAVMASGQPLLDQLGVAAPDVNRLAADVPRLARVARPTLKRLAPVLRRGAATSRRSAPLSKVLRRTRATRCPPRARPARCSRPSRAGASTATCCALFYNAALAAARYDAERTPAARRTWRSRRARTTRPRRPRAAAPAAVSRPAGRRRRPAGRPGARAGAGARAARRPPRDAARADPRPPAPQQPAGAGRRPPRPGPLVSRPCPRRRSASPSWTTCCDDRARPESLPSALVLRTCAWWAWPSSPSPRW